MNYLGASRTRYHRCEAFACPNGVGVIVPEHLRSSGHNGFLELDGFSRLAESEKAGGQILHGPQRPRMMIAEHLLLCRKNWFQKLSRTFIVAFQHAGGRKIILRVQCIWMLLPPSA